MGGGRWRHSRNQLEVQLLLLHSPAVTGKLNGTDLLGERDDQLPPSFTPIFFSQLLANSSGDGALISGCNGDRQCMYDALAMQDASAGLHTRTLFRTYQEMNATQSEC